MVSYAPQPMLICAEGVLVIILNAAGSASSVRSLRYENENKVSQTERDERSKGRQGSDGDIQARKRCDLREGVSDGE